MPGIFCCCREGPCSCIRLLLMRLWWLGCSDGSQRWVQQCPLLCPCGRAALMGHTAWYSTGYLNPSANLRNQGAVRKETELELPGSCEGAEIVTTSVTVLCWSG